ncbi:MAG: deoxyribonuclease V [Gemmatimonadetes bacterium]|nr:MAG: deoxyribonuclease V [Gemmatimonadota bacterium]
MTPVVTHEWSLSTTAAKALQNELVKKLVFTDLPLESIQWVAGADVAFHHDEAFAAVILLHFPELECVQECYARVRVRFPYVPGFLSFREGEVLLKAFAQLEHTPDVILFDGHGIAHPRRLGLAAHLGVLLDSPTIGCAKSRLVGSYILPALEKGATSNLMDQNEVIGKVVRTRTNVRPLFISPGHRMSLTSAVKISLACTSRYRLPEPTRQADRRVAEYKRIALAQQE